ncbi:hypothetical protein C7S16_3182 [Burkholderia thailandensis]|uniref:Uncharacterized protein n=1 Tax=Burkholderia thailandensis TaxID=57975 RepID=A0AAW9CYW5_BURTH|nr:hypothetical protein [Burkholderia thailandensis]MDW9255111.1 hypothetical protein [Burkholderia thailandensis]
MSPRCAVRRCGIASRRKGAPLCFDAQRNALYFFTPIEEFFCSS